MSIQVYGPACQVKVIKLVGRSGYVATRYTAAKRDIDLTPYLGDNGSWRTAKGLVDGVGGLSVVFADRADPVLQDTVYAMVEPMDMIEIRASRRPWLYSGRRLPLIMRGFVSSVRRGNTMGQDGRPINAVVIQGQDFGKLWHIHQVLFEVGYRIETFYMETFRLQAATGIEARIIPVNLYMQEVTAALNDKVAALQAYSCHLIPPFVVDASVPDGSVSANTVANYIGPYWGLVTMFADRPWNEIFIQDQEDGPHLVFRPCPYKDINGNFVINGAVDPGTIAIDDSSVVELNVERTDTDIANFFQVDPGYSSLDNYAALNVVAIQDGDALDFGYGNNAPELYGIKKMEAATHLLDTNLTTLPNVAAAGPIRDQASSTYPTWWKNRLDGLRAMNRDNGVFEKGDATVMGDESLVAGKFLRLTRGGLPSEYYIDRVDHSFTPLQTWMTSLALSRGTGFIVRNQIARSPIWMEGRKGPYST